MRRRRWVAGSSLAALAAAAAVVTAAFGQTRARPARPGPKPKPAASADNPYDDEPPAPSSPAAGSGAPAPSSPPETARPPAPAPEPPDARRLSPLNPAPNELSDAGPPAMSVDYDRLLADIAALRARAAAVGDALFHSRIAVALETSGDHARIASLSVSLDDGVVWTSPASFRADEPTTVYDHAVAPGHHAVTVDVERRDDRADSFRSAQRSRFAVEVPADQRLTLEVKLWDDSTMGGDFPTDKNGQYDLRVRVRAKALPLPR